jgi:hypothetical protein
MIYTLELRINFKKLFDISITLLHSSIISIDNLSFNKLIK